MDPSSPSPDPYYIDLVVKLAIDGVHQGARPFSALIVKDGEVIAQSVNTTYLSGDITAHAEIECIRDVSKRYTREELKDAVLYASGQPCPMCQSAIHLIGLKHVFFVNSNADGQPYGLSTAHIQEELRKPLDQQSIPLIKVDHENNIYSLWDSKNKPKD